MIRYTELLYAETNTRSISHKTPPEELLLPPQTLFIHQIEVTQGLLYL